MEKRVNVSVDVATKISKAIENIAKTRYVGAKHDQYAQLYATTTGSEHLGRILSRQGVLDDIEVFADYGNYVVIIDVRHRYPCELRRVDPKKRDAWVVTEIAV